MKWLVKGQSNINGFLDLLSQSSMIGPTHKLDYMYLELLVSTDYVIEALSWLIKYGASKGSWERGLYGIIDVAMRYMWLHVLSFHPYYITYQA